MRYRAVIAVMLGMGALRAIAAPPATDKQQDIAYLLRQIRLGEAQHRETLVRQSLFRLQLLAPDAPDVLAARLRYALRQGKTDEAQTLLRQLAARAPRSTAYRDAQILLRLANGKGREQLQQARLLAASGRIADAVAAFDNLYGGAPPAGELADEYWLLAAKLPARRQQALRQLLAINAATPGDAQIAGPLAQMLFADHRPQQAFALLRQLARTDSGRTTAAAIWFDQLSALSVSEQSVTALRQFIALFNTGDAVDNARQLLAQQQQKLADPAFRARRAALAAIEAGRYSQALRQLHRVQSAAARDGELAGVLGQTLSHLGQRAAAIAALQKALKLSPDSDDSGKWRSLLQTNQYWLLIGQGDAALKAGRLTLAQQRYQRAQRLDPTDSYAPLGLGDVAAARHDDAAAEREYRLALRLDADNSNALRGLANLYRRQSPDRAQQFIASLSARQRAKIDDIWRSLRDDQLQQQAERLEQQGQWMRAAAIQRQRLALDGDNPWTWYHLAGDLAAAGQRAQADWLFAQFARPRSGAIICANCING